ncbi:hypothetical protein BMS3Abin02_00537 [bacterium BMS3Abin02]|nr:hypothetical protein BMS3Abin02_00537 [bacterium BMS3Abin02]GBE23002.1 hypothetical protein BMS3Bbin01_02381 [bacterium BMS3Bbin01]HDH26525.1 DUF3263 domain-containing protein [Actinomycetota bacterium]HDL50246.1 DUF3263 domain-containing protein [Actinomycetota bacterium]
MLSQRDKMVLDFERSWWMLPGPKDRAVREYLGVSAGSYYRILRRLVDEPEALDYDPMTIRRLQRLKATRARSASLPANTAKT